MTFSRLVPVAARSTQDEDLSEEALILLAPDDENPHGEPGTR
jgi:hypothetical protein